jgi:hypothetical protein
VSTAAAGHKVTVRLVRDRTQAGLLDRPRKRWLRLARDWVRRPPRTPGRGSAAGRHG